VKILGANLDQFPEIVQFKRVLIGVQNDRGLSPVENGKRPSSAMRKPAPGSLPIFCKGITSPCSLKGRQKRKKPFEARGESHAGHLVFMPDFRGRLPQIVPGTGRGAGMGDLLGRRDFELQNIHDFVLLWKATLKREKSIVKPNTISLRRS
jgi:poly(A) polymerase